MVSVEIDTEMFVDGVEVSGTSVEELEGLSNVVAAISVEVDSCVELRALTG